MTEQVLFYKSLKGLAKQNFRVSKSKENNRCMYRSPNGDKCGVGVLLTQKELCRVMDEYNCNHDPVRTMLETTGIKRFYDFLDLLEDLQYWHDTCLIEEGGLDKNAVYELEKLAMKYRAEVPPYIGKFLTR
jgi:hypothetical protein